MGAEGGVAHLPFPYASGEVVLVQLVQKMHILAFTHAQGSLSKEFPCPTWIKRFLPTHRRLIKRISMYYMDKMAFLPTHRGLIWGSSLTSFCVRASPHAIVSYPRLDP